MSEQQQDGPRRNNNRNQNNNKNRNNNNRNRSNNNSNRNSNSNSNRKPRQNKPKPLVLSTWQKILIFCNITSEDKIRKQLQANRPARNQPKTTATAASSNKKTSEAKPARTNTRVAKEKLAPQKIDVETPRLYVGNLSYDATEYDIEDLFKGIGSVKNVEIIYNRHTHKSKGYGFVQMLNVDEAKRAVDVLHDQPFLGRNLIVNGSKARKASDPNSNDYVADQETTPETSEEPAA